MSRVEVRVPEAEALLTPAEVSDMYRVDVKTVTRWAKAGRIASIRTPGNHRRYLRVEIEALLRGTPLTPAEVEAAKSRIWGSR